MDMFQIGSSWKTILSRYHMVIDYRTRVPDTDNCGAKQCDQDFATIIAEENLKSEDT